jgi:hypothetical protein
MSAGESPGTREQMSDGILTPTTGTGGVTVFRAALTTALARSGLSLRGAAIASGLPPTTVRSWAIGSSEPTRSGLEWLALTLGEPTLAELIDVRHDRIRMTCRTCPAVVEVTPGEARKRQKRRDPARFVVDWEQGTAEFICKSCSSRANVLGGTQRIKRRQGHKGLWAKAQGLVIWQQANPDEHRSHGVETRFKPGESRELSPRDRARWRLGLFWPQLVGTLSLCALCHKMLYTTAGTVQVNERRDRHAEGRFHKPCLTLWQRSATCRQWESDARKAGRSGAPIPSFPLPPPAAHRHVTAASLADGYATTVRYFWQREGSGRAARDEYGQIRTPAWLTGQLGLSRQGLLDRVRRFLALLPDEPIATGSVKSWRDVFLTLGLDRVDSE